MKKRTFVLLLGLILSFALTLSSCENIVLQEEKEAEKDGKEEEREVAFLPDKKEYDGYVYTVAVTEGTKGSFFSTEEQESIVENAIITRNSLVENKYGIVIEEKKIKESNALSALKDAERSGKQFADLLCLPGATLVAMAQQNLLYNLFGTGHLNINNHYMDTENIKNTTANSSLHILYDSASPYYDETYLLFCNLELIKEKGLKDPSYLVLAGEWTWEKFVFYAETVASRIMNKETADLLNDVYGYGSYFDDKNLVLTIWHGYGVPFFGNTYKNEVKAPSDTKAIVEITKEIKSIISSKSRYPGSGGDALSAFMGGRMGFLFHKLEYAAAFAEVETEWCVLPLPKRSTASDRHYSFVDPYGSALAVPAGVSDPERSILLLNAFSAASGEAVKEAVQDKYINLYFRNNQSTVMLEFILDSVYMDFAALYGSQIKKVSDISTTLIVNAVLENENLANRVERLKEGFETFSKETFS